MSTTRIGRMGIIAVLALGIVGAGLASTAQALPCPNSKNFCGFQNFDFQGNRLFNFNATDALLGDNVNITDDVLSSARNHSSGGILCFSEAVTALPDYTHGWMSANTQGGDVGDLRDLGANNVADYVRWTLGSGGCPGN